MQRKTKSIFQVKVQEGNPELGPVHMGRSSGVASPTI